MRYLLILSGHGSGVTDDFFLGVDASNDSLTIPELIVALHLANENIATGGTAKRTTKAKGKRMIDILGLDACFMAMGEIAYALRDEAGILIGAEGFEPELGWPYRSLLAEVKKTVDANDGQPLPPRELAALIVKHYVQTYADFDRTAGRSVDLSAVSLHDMDKLTRPFGARHCALQSGASRSTAGRPGAWLAQTYKFDQFVDLRDFCSQLRQVFPARSPVGRAAGRVIQVLERDVVVSAGCSGFSCQHSYGLSV